MCCQPYIKASIYNICYAIFFTAYFLAQYYLDTEYYLSDLCLSPYIMLSIGVFYFISAIISLFMIQNSKFLFPHGLYILNLIYSIIGLLHFAACTIPINVIADTDYEFFYFVPPVPIYISQIACYTYFMKWLKNKIYEQNQERKAIINRQRRQIEPQRVKQELPKTNMISIVEQEGFISV